MIFRKALLIVAATSSICSCGKEPTLSDTTPPWTIGDLTVRATREGFYLRWTATGDDGNQGRASHYDLRYAPGDLEAGWESAYIVSNLPSPSLPGHSDSVTVLGIGAGPWEFGIKSVDDAGFWSRISNIVVAAFDTIPPETISDLEVRSTTQGFYLRWTAPGDDGSQGQTTRYDIRYAAGNLANVWESANVVQFSPTPASAGHVDSAKVMGVGMGPWEFGIKSMDDADNWSSISNIVTTTIPDDVIQPATVTDLRVDMVTEGSVVLCWTASGDDGASGNAWAYDIRYANAPITPESWAEATHVPTPVPRPSGEDEFFTLQGLQQGGSYHFALVVIDDVENESGVSNSPNAVIPSAAQITFRAQSTFDPDWSPNGQSIVFNSQAEIQPGVIRSELFVIPAGGGSAVRYTSISDGATQASWSPDGTKLAFRMYMDGNRKVLGVMDALPDAPPQVLADHSGEAVSGPRWSPDGTRIAYVVTGPSYGQPPGSMIYTIASDGGLPEALAGNYSWVVSGLDWSPDGSEIAYSSNQNGRHHVFVMPSTGGAATQLTNGPEDETTPAWSPDGSKIAYVTVSPQEIRIIYRNGGNPTRVTFDAIHLPYRKTTWSPDGGAIAFGATENQITNLWRLRVR